MPQQCCWVHLACPKLKLKACCEKAHLIAGSRAPNLKVWKRELETVVAAQWGLGFLLPFFSVYRERERVRESNERDTVTVKPNPEGSSSEGSRTVRVSVNEGQFRRFGDHRRFHPRQPLRRRPQGSRNRQPQRRSRRHPLRRRSRARQQTCLRSRVTLQVNLPS